MTRPKDTKQHQVLTRCQQKRRLCTHKPKMELQEKLALINENLIEVLNPELIEEPLRKAVTQGSIG